MRSKIGRMVSVAGAGLLLWLPARGGSAQFDAAQNSPSSYPPSVLSQTGARGRAEDPELAGANASMEAQVQKSRNADRQRKIKADTDRLLELATELKAQMDKPEKSAPPGDSARKAEEIEKLARSVRDKMKG